MIRPLVLAGALVASSWLTGCATEPAPTATAGAASAGAHDEHDHAHGDDHGDEHSDDHGDEHGGEHGDGHDHAAHAGGETTAAVPDDWCAEHGLPESMCTLCNPQLVAAFQASGDWCGGHGFPESVCPQCNPMTPPPGVRAPDATVTIHPDAVARIGLTTERAQTAALQPNVRMAAQVAWDPDRVVTVAAPMDGRLTEMLVATGAQVEAGQPLAILQSEGATTLRTTLAQARATREATAQTLARQQQLRDEGLNATRALEDAQAAHAQAVLAVRGAQAALEAAGVVANEPTITIHAPAAGVVLARLSSPGATVSAADPLFTVADSSSVQVIGQAWPAQAAQLTVGQAVTVQLPGHAPLAGTIDRLGASYAPDRQTRAVVVVLPNPTGAIVPGLLGNLEVHADTTASAPTIPVDALQLHAGQPVVFVPTGSTGTYAVRHVTPGVEVDGRVAIQAGLARNEEVVVRGAFALKSELMRDLLADSCHGH